MDSLPFLTPRQGDMLKQIKKKMIFLINSYRNPVLLVGLFFVLTIMTILTFLGVSCRFLLWLSIYPRCNCCSFPFSRFRFCFFCFELCLGRPLHLCSFNFLFSRWRADTLSLWDLTIKPDAHCLVYAPTSQGGRTTYSNYRGRPSFDTAVVEMHLTLNPNPSPTPNAWGFSRNFLEMKMVDIMRN